MRRASKIPCLLLAALSMAACDKPGAYGDTSSIVAAAAPELWQEIEDSVYAALEPTIWTVRDEKAFTVTWAEPQGDGWSDLLQFRQMLLIGTADRPWIAAALDATGEESFSPPQVVQAQNVWARGQLVTVLLLPENDQVEAALGQLDDLAELYDRQYRQWALARMFVSGRDSALVQTLRDGAGFSILLPEVYYWESRDSVYVFRNDNPDPSELIRQILVTWESPIPTDMEAEELLEWRAELAEANYSYPQVVDLSNAQAEAMEFRGKEAYQIQAVWQNPPDANWPAAGPFILRAVRCPSQDRLYVLDAWLYAPGREKYEYMIQLQTILDSFRCGDET